MFSGLFKTLLEPFTSAADMASHEQLRYYYGDKRPNAIFIGSNNNEADLNLNSNTTTYMGRLIDQINGPSNYAGQRGADRRSTPVNSSNILRVNNDLTGTILSDRNTACKGEATGLNAKFLHLSDMAANVNPESKMRCGWIYNTANPSQGEGVYGNMNGPVVDSTATGRWLWDLADARKRYHLYICNQANTAGASCTTVESYSNICGFCKTTNKFIPINGSVAAYPSEGNNGCTAANIVTRASMCPVAPPPPPPGSPASVVAAWSASRGPCDPLANGALPRDCLVRTAGQAGCSNAGTIIKALESGSDTNYLDTLTQAQSYITYQQRAIDGLNETALKSGKLTAADALMDFQDVYNSTNSPNLGLRAAAIDLCFTKGAFEQFDFCSELQPTTRGPFSLECLQKEFKRAGGQETGSMYPSASNLTNWNRYDTWRDVTDAIGTLSANASSPDRAIQERSIRSFQGIPLDNKSAPVFPLNSLNNVEIFWFTPDTNIRDGSTYNTIFLGRRIRSQIPNLTNTSGIPGAIATTGSFVFFTNMYVTQPYSFNVKFTGDSGFIFARNRGSTVGGNRTIPMANNYNMAAYGNGVSVQNQELSGLYNTLNNGSTSETTTPWTLQPDKPNILTGYYLGNGKNFRIDIKQPLEVPVPSWCGSYGRPSPDNSIRLYTESECLTTLSGSHYANDECAGRGGSISAQCRGLNYQWGPIPGPMLFLIQDPYAPMISFNVYPQQVYLSYNCDFYFMDKRLSSHKMKWSVFNNSGPTPSFSTDNKDSPTYPLGMNYMRFAGGSGIRSQFELKIYSFMTLVYIVRFTKVPASGIFAEPFVIWGPADYPTIFVVGKGNNTAQLQVGSGLNKTGTTEIISGSVRAPPRSTDGPTITAGGTYIITLNANRTNASDIYSLNSLTIGAALLSDLQSDPSMLRKSSPVVWTDRTSLDNPNSSSGGWFLVTANSDCQYDLFSIQMFDYILAGVNLGHVANGDWAKPAPNPANSSATDQNPYV
jgi:hypothetical protein